MFSLLRTKLPELVLNFSIHATTAFTNLGSTLSYLFCKISIALSLILSGAFRSMCYAVGLVILGVPKIRLAFSSEIP